MKTITQLNEEAVKAGLHETYHATAQEALDNARERSTKSNRTVYVFKMESGYMVCVHGVPKIGFTPIITFTRGK